MLSSGYVTSLAVAQAFAGQFSHALIDERAHVSLLDAAPFLDCPVLKFKHRDVVDFADACGDAAVARGPLCSRTDYSRTTARWRR